MSPEAKLRYIARWCGALVCALGLVALAGWLGGFDALWALRPTPQPMKANTALCLALAGAALWLQAGGRSRAGLAAAGIAFAVSGATLLEHLFALDFGIRELIVKDATGFGAKPGQMNLHVAAGLFGATLALLCLAQERGRTRWPFSAWFANLVVSASVASILTLGLIDLPGVTRPFLFGLHVSLALLLLGIGTLFARPEDTPIRTLFSTTAGGVFARRLFFGVAIVPLFLACCFVWVLNQQILSIADGAFLLTVGLVLAGFAVALFSIEVALSIHEGREIAEQDRDSLTSRLQQQTALLQETVEQRTRELREANTSLREAADSNALLALVAHNTTNGVIITDAQSRIEWVNSAFERLTGYLLDDVKGRRTGDVLEGPETSPAAVQKLRDAENRGEPCEIEILHYAKDGRRIRVVVDLQPVRDREGRVINFVADLTDVTTRYNDQERVTLLNERFKLATRAAALGVWEWDAVRQRSIWDERTLEIYGLSLEKFKGTREDWIDRLHPEDAERMRAAIHEAFVKADSYELEFRIRRANDGQVRTVQTRAIVQRDAQRNLLRVTGTERDITDEREATQRMKVLNERLGLALRSSNYGVWEYDIAAGKRYWDDRVLEMYGLRPGEFDGSETAWQLTFHIEDRQRGIEHVRRAIESGASDYDLQFRIVRPDGTIRHLEAHGHVQRDNQGRATRLVGLSRDVTDRRQLEQALEIAEHRWQLAIEGTNDSIWDWDITTGQVFHDARWPRMLGYDSGELKNTNDAWKALAHPDDLLENEAALNAHFAQRTPFYRHELRMRTKDGGWAWILDRGKVVQRAADGRPLRMVGTHSDMTARKQLEERLHKSEELANEVSRLAQIGGWEIDMDSSRVIWTDGTRRIHEVDESFQPSIESVWQFFPAAAQTTVQSALAAATPTAPSFDVEVPLLTARGRRIWVRILGHGEFRHGRTVSVRGAIQDVTARHESEHARRELETQLFQAQKMETLGTLAGGIAHDFNNLLTGIIGYHELAADSLPEDHPSRECLGEARNASLRARELVEQILTFGRHTGNTEHAAIDLMLVIEEARRFLRSTLPANITIELSSAPHCPHVLADATQIHQVILNLGSNAAHAMRLNGGVLKITLEPTEVSPDLALTLGGPAANSYVRLSVSDTGHGMDESTRRRIFDPFFTTKNTREGTGLGLAVVHGIVRSHRGAIDVESTPGSGATFHIYLPTAEKEKPQAGAPADAAPRGGGEYVCVVDDEEVVGSCTKLVLESRGYRSLIFSSAEDCLAEMQANPRNCAVLVTDQTMPGMQGTELAAAMRKLNPQLPIVIMSGYFSKISPQALDELGQIELLAKPFTTDELAHAVHRAMQAGSAASV